jgi:hypothetical protein
MPFQNAIIVPKIWLGANLDNSLETNGIVGWGQILDFPPGRNDCQYFLQIVKDGRKISKPV